MYPRQRNGDNVKTIRARHHKVVAIACALALIGAACSSSDGNGASAAGDSTTSSADAATSSSVPERVTIRLAASTQGGGYPTPYAAVRGPGFLMATFMFDSLGFPDSTGEPKPWLAKSWESSDDGLTWTFHLHENAMWQDGEPLTADDVAFTFDYNTNGPGADTGVRLPVLAGGGTYIDSVTATDPTTVVFKLSSAQPSFLADIAGTFGMQIMPKHIWESVDDPAHFQGDQALIGSGPYKVKSFDQTNNTFDLVANDDFYLGKPVVKEVQLVQVNDPLLALQNGELDAASAGNGSIPESQFNQLSKDFKLLTAKGEFNEALFFNLSAGFPYDNVDFRHAVAYALDREDMVKRLASGRGVPGSSGQLGPANSYLNPDLPAYALDPDKANTLLDKVGLKDADGDGVRDKPDGSSFSIPLLASSRDSDQAQLVIEYLKAVGLEVDLTTVDQPTSDSRDSSGDYDMAIVHFGGLSSDPNVLTTRFASTSKSKSFTRVTGYANSKFDDLAAEAATTVDIDARTQIVYQMQSILAEDLPALSMYVPDQLYFVNDQFFQGWAFTPMCPPCGVGKNKRNLSSGSADPVSG